MTTAKVDELIKKYEKAEAEAEAAKKEKEKEKQQKPWTIVFDDCYPWVWSFLWSTVSFYQCDHICGLISNSCIELMAKHVK